MQILAENLGCQVASLPTNYLGIPLGAQNNELEMWSEVLEGCDKKAKKMEESIPISGR